MNISKITNMRYRFKRRWRMTIYNWRMDCNFSIKYAFIRIIDDYSYRIGWNKLSVLFHKKKDDYILNWLDCCLNPVINKYKKCDFDGEYDENSPIWVCWWTGIDDAPLIVQQCVKSIYSKAGKRKVIFITEKNYYQYIKIPDYMLKKMQSGKMGLAHFADYVRVSLINKYGGLWLDATIYCADSIPEDYFVNPFFTCKSKYTESRYISHYEWVTFCLGGWKNNSWYSFIQEAIETYWKKNDYAIDYLFFDYLIALAYKKIPYIHELMDEVKINNIHRDDLQEAMNRSISAKNFYKILKSDTVLYKLSWRENYNELMENGDETIYSYFLKLDI